MKKNNCFVLAVGVSDYVSLKSLKACHADAAAVVDTLERKGFVRHDLLLSPSMHDVAKSLRALVERAADEADTIVFYFSGHGAEIAGEHIFLGPNMDGAIGDTYADRLRLAEVLDILNGSRGTKVVIADACRSTATGELLATDLTQHEAGWHQTMRSASRVLIMYATAAGQVAFGANHATPLSAFTNCLVDNMRDYNIGFAEVFFRVAKKLKADSISTNQEPWFYTSAGDEVIADANPISFAVESGSSNISSVSRWSYLEASETTELMLERPHRIWGKTSTSLAAFDFPSQNAPYSIAVSQSGDTAVVLDRNRARMIPDAKNAFANLGSSKAPYPKLQLINLHKEVTGLAFAVVSPSGKHVAIGALFRAKSGKSAFYTQTETLTLWKMHNYVKPKGRRITINGVPKLDANAAIWIGESDCYVSFSSPHKVRSELWKLTLTEADTSFERIFECEGIVTALTVRDAQSLWLGFHDGHVECRDLNGFLCSSFTRTAGLRLQRGYIPKNWSNEHGRIESFATTPAVSSLGYLSKIETLAVGYYDQVVTFYDCKLKGHIADLAPTPNSSDSVTRVLPDPSKNCFSALLGGRIFRCAVGFSENVRE
ncbi:caspase family protein [Burkholderia cepacia]|uniref:caspase family protein n=1 Tax=Burkholderia cepacia TaxID=292 RepID=UPI001CF1081B|nr:caspase family protein [Burkholderia cepacia]MCA8024009.1 caspase family protein [Burkholderia cepacia]